VKLVPVGKGMAGLAVERNAPINTCNIQTDTTGDVRSGAKATGLEGAIVVPIQRDGAAIGALGIANRSERTFTDAEIADLLREGQAIGAAN
jgi:putative methionine-R-sulfoxide reductase with GAF domain